MTAYGSDFIFIRDFASEIRALKELTLKASIQPDTSKKKKKKKKEESESYGEEEDDAEPENKNEEDPNEADPLQLIVDCLGNSPIVL